MELLERLDHPVIPVSVESQDHLDKKVTQGSLDLKVLKVNLATRVSEVCQVIPVYQVWLDNLEKKDRRDQWVCLDKMV